MAHVAQYLHVHVPSDSGPWDIAQTLRDGDTHDVWGTQLHCTLSLPGAVLTLGRGTGLPPATLRVCTVYMYLVSMYNVHVPTCVHLIAKNTSCMCTLHIQLSISWNAINL